MAGTITINGLKFMLETAFRGTWQGSTPPTKLYVALVKSTTTPTKETDTLCDLDEILEGNGYTSGGIAVNRDSIDFDTLSENGDYVYIQLKDIIFEAQGGDIPSDATGFRFAVLTDANSTISDRKVLAVFDLKDDVIIPDGDNMTLEDMEMGVM